MSTLWSATAAPPTAVAAAIAKCCHVPVACRSFAAGRSCSHPKPMSISYTRAFRAMSWLINQSMCAQARRIWNDQVDCWVSSPIQHRQGLGTGLRRRTLRIHVRQSLELLTTSFSIAVSCISSHAPKRASSSRQDEIRSVGKGSHELPSEDTGEQQHSLLPRLAFLHAGCNSLLSCSI